MPFQEPLRPFDVDILESTGTEQEWEILRQGWVEKRNKKEEGKKRNLMPSIFSFKNHKTVEFTCHPTRHHCSCHHVLQFFHYKAKSELFGEKLPEVFAQVKSVNFPQLSGVREFTLQMEEQNVPEALLVCGRRKATIHSQIRKGLR